jgi:hypothetical protein
VFCNTLKNIDNYNEGLPFELTSKSYITLCSPQLAFTLVSCSAYSSTQKMEAICSSEMSVDFQRTTRRYSQKIVLFITPALRTSNPMY